MRRIIVKHVFNYILVPIALVIAFWVAPVQAASLEQTIRVGILSNQEHVLISSDTNFAMLNGETGQWIAHLDAGEKATITVEEGSITINGKKTKDVTSNIIKVIDFSLLTFKDNDGHYFEVNKKQYRGNIDIHLTHGKTGLTIVNTLPIEQYLDGVIASEMPSSWHLEALKAQTVAARTYALYNLNKHQGDDYDVCATTDCQVYGGLGSESPQVSKAVDETAGQVIMNQGKVIPAYFHSSSGGYTENSENVWGTYQPYLRGTIDYDQKSPQYKWEKKLTVSELQAAMNKAGYTIGNIKAIELAPLTDKPMSNPERGVSGRVKVIQFIGSTSSAKLTGEQLRKILDLKSTLFDVAVSAPNLLPIRGQSLNTDKKGVHQMSGKSNETIVISGFGWGHGLGLSQWGAKAMAEQGPQGDTTYFKEILKHYYQGTTIEKVY